MSSQTEFLDDLRFFRFFYYGKVNFKMRFWVRWDIFVINEKKEFKRRILRGKYFFKKEISDFFIFLVVRQLRNEGTLFALQLARSSFGSDEHLKWWSLLQKK